ncbi:5'-3' deoxyribonucleotidase [Cronobacter phage S13]|uniref:Uncharacterized protein n=1 Tax=Cronobacter phage LPCS28 TaxID=2924885 RepID=A0AAE9GAV0_9CAUD|nr:5'-3' deoxyribonucleotidase [Cronobacter phage S13]YP_010665911.1 5'-3' deoxyribonucleotidase [Cronobacter phage LPCS28]AIA64859.1 hypothetical protein S13_060 [Cronobacter phage S13]UNY47100.1 hypothetical protein EHEKIMEA_00218 [Cronobacter phage LPCS28]
MKFDNEITRIYFDMDGTIADYEKRFIEIWGAELFEKFKTMTKEEKRPYQEAMANDNFYEELDTMPMFERMYTLFKSGKDVAILTSVGKIESLKVAQQKLRWLERNCPKDLYNHLSKRFFYVKTSAEKAYFANKNVALVDDREKAWRPFLEAGGHVVIV